MVEVTREVHTDIVKRLSMLANTSMRSVLTLRVLLNMRFTPTPSRSHRSALPGIVEEGKITLTYDLSLYRCTRYENDRTKVHVSFTFPCASFKEEEEKDSLNKSA